VAGTALVTGAAKRVGRAIALELAAAGFDIALHYGTSADEAAATARDIEALGRRAVPLAADLADETAVERLVPRAAAALGPITALVNSASLFDRDEALTVTREGWDRQLAVNLRAPFVLMQGFAPRAARAGGRRDRQCARPAWC